MTRRYHTCPNCGRLVADTGTTFHGPQHATYHRLAAHKTAPNADAAPCPARLVPA